MNPTTYTKRTAPHRGTVALQMVNDWIAHGTKIRPVRLVGSGKRIPFDQLPEPCQQLVKQDYQQLWNI